MKTKNPLLIFALAGALIFSLTAGSIVLADNEKNKNNKKEPEANIANVSPKDLKQQLIVEETEAGIMVLARGTKITEITSTGGATLNLLKVKIFGQECQVQVSDATKIVRQYWGKSAIDLSEFSVGDIVNVWGSLESSAPCLVKAKTVRNVSIQQKHGVFTGKITDINSGAGSFTLQTERAGALTVVSGPNTKIYQGDVLKAFSDLQKDMKVMVRGIWDRTLSKIQALLIRIKPTEKD